MRQDLEEWAEDHGYWHGICPVHGSFWTDTGHACEQCRDDQEDWQEGAPEPGEEDDDAEVDQNS